MSQLTDRLLRAAESAMNRQILVEAHNEIERLSAENSRLREALLEVHRDIWLTLEWAGLEAQAYKGPVSTEKTDVSPNTAIEKDTQSGDDCTQSGNKSE